MTKILLVEDDKNLREIYGVRLLAEGYDIISAGDGEEALAMAIKEKPQLIISDVMMPRISGFDMLDILRSTSETKNIRVIIMTALSSEEQRARGEALGADKYLVKSQVGIEDVVRSVHDVLHDTPGTAAIDDSNKTDNETKSQTTEETKLAEPGVETTPISNPEIVNKQEPSMSNTDTKSDDFAAFVTGNNKQPSVAPTSNQQADNQTLEQLNSYNDTDTNSNSSDKPDNSLDTFGASYNAGDSTSKPYNGQPNIKPISNRFDRNI